MAERTIVHLLRHGEVYNPTGVLYGRLPEFHLSDLGQEMAQRVAEVTARRDIVDVVASPLDRAQETAAPIAAAHGLDIGTESDLIEAGNIFQGETVGVGDGILRRPRLWRHLWNPMRPSWGEPYTEIAGRMGSAVDAARGRARGHEGLLVSHQLPIWTWRLAMEQRRFAHDPRRRQCSLASLTSFTYDGDRLSAIVYTEPCADLVARSHKGAGA
jgi:broad specificity phosphatase PhoE